MANLFDKFIGIMGFGEEEFDDDFIEDYEEQSGKDSGRREHFYNKESLAKEPNKMSRDIPLKDSKRNKNTPIVSIHSQKQVRVIVVEPESFEEATKLADYLKSHKAVVLNLEKTDHNLAQRLVDFTCGTTYALGGKMQKIGNGIFMFVPNNVEICGEPGYRAGEKDIIWPKSSL